MVPTLQVLAIVGLSRSIVNPVGSLVLAKGRPDLAFKLNLCFVFLQLPAVYLGATLGGLAGVAWTVLALQVVDVASAYIFLIRPLIGPCLREYATSIAVPLATSIAMATLVLMVPLLVPAPALLTLAIQIAVGVVFYAVATFSLQRSKLEPFLGDLLPTKS